MDDVEKTARINMEGIRTEHFFGSITYFQTEVVFDRPSKLVLIDGQQRITTTMLFLVAYRDLTSDESTVRSIEKRYLKNEDADGDTEYKIKMKQVESDWRSYRDIILENELSNDEKNTAVYKNYVFFKNKLANMKQEEPEMFDSLIEKGLNNFSVITIQLEPDRNEWENPQEIFESMNSLGKPLSLADLVRNYLLLGLSPDRQTYLYNKYWLRIEETVPNEISDLLRDYMQMEDKKAYPKATEANYKKLYGKFKETFKNIEAEDLLKKLSEFSEIYAYIRLGKDTGDCKVNKYLEDMRAIGASTTYSFLMKLIYEWKHGNFDDKEIADILLAMNIFFLRRRILALTSPENKVMPGMVNEIPKLMEADDKKDALFRIFSSQESNFRLPNDIEMTRQLESMNFYNFKNCRFVLSLVEEKITKNRPSSDDELLQREHIMPQTLGDGWKEYLGEDYNTIHQTYVHNIGNLTLIRHNQELGNKTFEEKRHFYSELEGLQIAKKEIIDKDKWDEKAIKSRRDWMIKFILDKVLPIPDDMRKTNNFDTRKVRGLSFVDLQLIGSYITFIGDRSQTALVIDDKQVEFEGKKWRLSPLTRELHTRLGRVNASGAYQGAQYWEYEGIKLADII